MKTFLIIIISIISFECYSRDLGETEITADDGIEVFQEEKYYLLKKNVKIISDSFILNANKIKIFFEENLYDITKIEAYNKAKLISKNYNIDAEGENIFFTVKSEEIYVSGLNSKLITKETNMFSNGFININNSNGNFNINGDKSSLKAESVFISGENIKGKFIIKNNVKEVEFLNVKDINLSHIKTNDTEMYANIIKYNKVSSEIELENNVKIIRDGETITGDYGILNMNTNSYKVHSNKEKKVKVIISNKDE